MIKKVIEGLPLHYQKSNNIKFYESLSPVIDYLNELIESLKGQTSLMHATGIYLDFLGERYQEKRAGRDDEQYRKALVSKRMAVSGLPTTEFLIDIARQLSGAEITDFKTRYKGEVASQWIKADVGMDFKKIAKFPNLNDICEAGAVMYWELGFSDETTEFKIASGSSISKFIEIAADFDIDKTVHTTLDYKIATPLGITKYIVIE